MLKSLISCGRGLFVAVVLMLSQNSAQALPTVHDAAANFSPLANPNGVWTYGYSALGGTSYSLILFDRHGTVAGSNAFWGSNAVNNLNAPLAFKNIGITSINGTLPSQMALHPGPRANGDFAILRFAAPSTSVYDIVSSFFTGDIGDTSARVFKNSDFVNPLAAFASTTGNVAYNSTLSLAAGDMLDFVVGNNGSFNFDTTPISVVITERSAAVPEPGTLLLTALGFAFVGLRQRRDASRSSTG